MNKEYCLITGAHLRVQLHKAMGHVTMEILSSDSICWFYLLFYVIVMSEMRYAGLSAILNSCSDAQSGMWTFQFYRKEKER